MYIAYSKCNILTCRLLPNYQGHCKVLVSSLGKVRLSGLCHFYLHHMRGASLSPLLNHMYLTCVLQKHKFILLSTMCAILLNRIDFNLSGS